MDGTPEGKLTKIVCPPVEELSVIVNRIQCVQCGFVFRNESQFRMHDLKVHQHRNLDKIVKENVRYHCPATSCIYAPQSQRYFTTMKYLKQHYLKVHAAKTFACPHCSKSFSTEAAKGAHVRVCGTPFTCICLKTFTTYEALLTHAKRYSHVVDEKYKISSRRVTSKRQPVVRFARSSLSNASNNKPVMILPINQEDFVETTNRNNVGGKYPKATNDAAVQTDEFKRGKRTPSPSKYNSGRRRVSQQTQTQSSLPRVRKHSERSAETQTGEDRAASSIVEVAKVRRRKRNNLLRKSERAILKEDLGFTENFETEHLFSSSPLAALRHDVGLQDLWEEERNTSGTQTNSEESLLQALNDGVTQTNLEAFYNREEPTSMHCASQTTNLSALHYVEDTTVSNTFSFASSMNGVPRSDPMLTEETFGDRFSSIETQTEQAHLQSIFDPDALSRSFALSSSNTETQTTENFENIEQLLYSNTCTQTCDEILPSDLGLSNIQTQTAWPRLDDVTISTETQTRISTCHAGCNISIAARSWLHAQTNHTETQTDLLTILEELQ